MVHQSRTSGTYRAGDPLDSTGISRVFSDLRDELGIGPSTENGTPPTFHEIRSLSERLYEEERGKEFAQAVLGHKNASMTAKYNDLRGSGYKAVGDE